MSMKFSRTLCNLYKKFSYTHINLPGSTRKLLLSRRERFRNSCF